jgi:hypothetical protein
MNRRESLTSELLSWWGTPVILTLLVLGILLGIVVLGPS